MAVDQLPDLVLFEFFTLLNFEEKLKLKAVSRRLNCLLTGYLIEVPRRLFVHQKVISLNENWGSPEQPIKQEEFIQLKLFLKCLANGYFKNVKRLHLFELDRYSQDQPLFPSDAYRKYFFNCLAKLDELFVTGSAQIGRFFNADLSLEDSERFFPIDLPDLKSISIKKTGIFLEPSQSLQINSQQLENLVAWHFDEGSITLSYPEKIKYIECVHFSEEPFQPNVFFNLEHLKCQSIRTNFNLLKYPKLKKLDICPAAASPRTENEFQILHRLITQKDTLGRSDLEITVSGFKGFFQVAFKKWTREDEVTLEFENIKKLKHNFSNFVGPLPWRTTIHLTPELDADLESFPRFIRQFYLERVVLRNGPNPELVIKFLKEINGVNQLLINSCSYGNEFFDQLDSVPFISYLQISNSQISAVTSFDFICTTRCLRGITIIETILPLDDLGDLIERSKVERFSLRVNVNMNLRNMRKSILFVADRSDEPRYSVSYKCFKNLFETWKEAACFFRECELINLREDLYPSGDIGEVFGDKL